MYFKILEVFILKTLFHKGEYNFDPTIGEFGGYAISVSKL